MGKIKIVSDGLGHNTRVYDEHGNQLTSVRKVTWSCDARGMAVAVVEFIRPQVEVTGQLVDEHTELQPSG